jgi:cytochrome c oxidase subunit 2
MTFLIPLLPDTASTVAQRVDHLFDFLVTVCGLITVLVVCAVVFFCIRYRRRSEDEIPPAINSYLPLEATWIGGPLIVFLVMFFWGAHVYFQAFGRTEPALEVYGVGKQWMWKFQHPGGQREINQLHLPTGRTIKLTLASQDVIHSFFVPDFRIHRDALPHRYTTVWFQATKPGRYHLYCTEYCGANHSGMIGYVTVLAPAAYESWLATGPEGSLASQGQKLFAKLACNSCHTGTSRARGPDLETVYGSPVLLQSGETLTADEAYLRESILNPRAKVVAGYQPIMPTFEGQVSEDEIFQLIAYLRSLRTGREQLPPVSNPTGPQPPPANVPLGASATGTPMTSSAASPNSSPLASPVTNKAKQ